MAQAETPLMADLPEEWLAASTALTKVGVDYFGPYTVTNLANVQKTIVLSVYLSNCTSSSYRNGTKVENRYFS